jgi:hypothetical protein
MLIEKPGDGMSISRRNFLERAAAGSLAAKAGSLAAKAAVGAEGGKLTLPSRVLGRTGAKVSLLAMGGGSRFLSMPEDKAIESMNRAID